MSDDRCEDAPDPGNSEPDSSEPLGNRAIQRMPDRCTTGEVVRPVGANRQLITRSPTVIGWRASGEAVQDCLGVGLDFAVAAGGRDSNCTPGHRSGPLAVVAPVAVGEER